MGSLRGRPPRALAAASATDSRSARYTRSRQARLATRSRAVGPKAWPPAYAARSAPIQHRSDRLRSAVRLAHTCVEWFRSTSCASMIASTQPPCHNRLKLLNSFSVSLLAYSSPEAVQTTGTAATDRPIAGAARADMKGDEFRYGEGTMVRYALMRAERHVSAPRCRQPPHWTAFTPAKCDLPLPETVRGAILASGPLGIWQMSARGYDEIRSDDPYHTHLRDRSARVCPATAAEHHHCGQPFGDGSVRVGNRQPVA